MTIYTNWYNEEIKFNGLFTSSMQALQKAGITSLMLDKETLKVKIEKIDDLVMLLMVALWYGKYYCFNYHPSRTDVTLTHTLDKCDMDQQVDESLASLRRLYVK